MAEASRPHLLDLLPNELLLLILGHPDLPSEVLLNLSMLCRRLNYLALPIYFDKHGMKDPAENANLTLRLDNRDALSALQMALFIPAVIKLSCLFPDYETSLRRLFPHICRLRALITRLDFVRQVTLVLGASGSFCSATGDGAETWALEFGKLLNIILKRGCTSITLRYGTYFSKAYELHPHRAGPANALKSAVRNLLPGRPHPVPLVGWEVLQMTAGLIPMELDSEARSSTTLTHFSIESAILLTPPCFSWALSALRHSPITNLEFRGVTLPHNIWSAVLPPIANCVPALTELKLSDLYGLSGVDILLYLTKLPRLRILTVGYTEYSRHVQSSFPDSGPVPKLHELTHLHAPSPLVYHLLRKNALPNLASLCITPRRLIMGFRGIRHIGRSVSDIVRRLEKFKLAPTISLEIHCGGDSEAEMAADLAAPLAPGEELTRALQAITRLIVYCGTEIATAELGTLARWIARFPTLLHVALHVQHAPDTWATADTVRAIAEWNPDVQSLELNGTLFDAANTLKHSEVFV
ncbi:hypothetical protein DFH06DRAFT_298808 [Mycena polygramma]|nr:hypothetical protein DFH06DRAFT_298808 [Mycena polygramma]